MNKGIYFAAFTALLWGFLAIALKVSLDSLPPLTVTWLRFTIAFITLFLYYIIFDKSKVSILKMPPILAVFAGICLGFNYLGFIGGINLTTPSISQVFIQTGPVILAISGIIIFKEKVNIQQAIGLVIVVLGLSIFYKEKIVNLGGGIKEYKLGVLITLFGAISWVGYGIFQKFAVRKHNPMQLNLILFGIPAIALIPFVSFDKFIGLNIKDWLLLVFLGMNTLAAYGSLSYALKYLETNKVSAIVTLNPLITFTLMVYLSKKHVSWIEPEQFSIIAYLGAITVLIGVLLTVYKKNN